MIYITGDCHGDYGRLSSKNFPEQKEMTKRDFVIICGDFGYWLPSKSQDYWLKWLTDKPFTTLFVDGNHEDFDDLEKLPVSCWNGGKIHEVTESVYHLMRGQIFNLDGCRIFTFGGAGSHDISGGILDPLAPDFEKRRQKLNKGNLPYRINHFSWWAREMPSQTEMEEGLKNLEQYQYKVDYVISHCCATSTQQLLSGGLFKSDILTDYLEVIRQKTDFKRWFFGHYHDNRQINEREILMYEQIIRIW